MVFSHCHFGCTVPGCLDICYENHGWALLASARGEKLGGKELCRDLDNFLQFILMP